MDKNEFIEKLRRALSGGLGSAQVADNIRYYQDYIESEIRKGKSEEEVIESLGDPRLLAKSIIEANKHSGENYGSNREYDEEMADNGEERNFGRFLDHVFMMPGWLIGLIITVIVVIIIGLITSLISVFAPVIIVVLIIVLLIKLIQGRSM